MTTVIVVPPSASDLHESEEIETSNLPTNQNENKKNYISNLCVHYKFLILVWLSCIKIMIDLVIILCLFLLAEIQIFAWKNNFGKGSDFLNQMHTACVRCIIVTVFIVLAQAICILGFRGTIKVCRKISCWDWIVVLFISCAVGGLFCILYSLKSVQILVDTMFEVPGLSSSVIQESISIERKPVSTKPNSVSYLEHVSIICNIQQIIFLIMLIRWKPTNFEWGKYQDKIKQAAAPPSPNDQNKIV